MPKLIGISLASELITSVLFNVGLLGYLMWRYLTDAGFTLGDFSVGISATWKLFMRVNQLIGFLAQFQEHSIYAEKFRTFVTQKPQIINGTEKAEAFESLELRHVSFTYPFPEKNPKQVLSDVSFTVRKGEKIAIVGYNGAGKTTLTKLLMRLYDVTDGAIFYNGTDIRKY
ncbi:MAG: ATP-binding cassette domain-containing protein [Gallintestinimicrobium sp.]